MHGTRAMTNKNLITYTEVMSEQDALCTLTWKGRDGLVAYGVGQGFHQVAHPFGLDQDWFRLQQRLHRSYKPRGDHQVLPG